MYCKFAFATLAVLIGNEFVIADQIPSTTTAAELWNPWTWFWPYAIAAAEGYRDYFQKAQKATNELYVQAEKVNAFPWITGKPSTPQGNNQGGNGGQSNQGGSTQPNQNSGNQQNNQAQPNQNGGNQQNSQAGTSQQNPNPAQGAPQEQGGKGGAESPGVQVQGNTQEEGKTNAGIGANA